MLFLPTRPALRLALLASTLLASALANAQTTYRWIDPATGGTVISDQKPPPSAKQVIQRDGEPSGEQRLPYAVRQTAEKFPVTLYTSANCIDACKQGRDLLNGRGIPFSEKMPKSQEEIDALSKLLGGEASVPSLVVGQQSFKGFESTAWTKLLDLAGYPKTAPYGAKPSGAFAK